VAEPTSNNAIWVRSDLAPDGKTYILSIEWGADRSFVPTNPLAYALAALRAAEYAAYDAAVLAQMTPAMKGNQRLALSIVADLRADRPPISDEATAPLTFTPIVSGRNSRPYVLVHGADGKPVTQWTPADVRHHVEGVLAALAVVDLDAAYRRYLVGSLTLDHAKASGVINALADYRHHDEEPTDGRQ